MGALRLEPERRRALADGVPIGLSGAEFAVLELLVRRRGVPLSREAIAAALPSLPDARLVDVYVLRGRRKLEAAGLGPVIETVWGRGYTVAEQEEDGPLAPPPPSAPGTVLVPA